MLIHNPIFTGSIQLNGTDISQISTVSSDSSSFASRITSTESTASAFILASGSFSTRATNTEATASAFVTASGSLSTRVTAAEATASAFITASGSLAARLTSNEAKTGSFATTGSNFFIGNQVITGSVYIANDLVVQGSSSLQNITASVVSIGTNTVILNTNTPILQFGGISVFDSGSTQGRSGSLLWNSINDHWINVNPSGSDEGYNSAMVINGPKNTGSLGQEAGLTTGYVPRSQGEDHIEDSNIYSSGSLVGIGTTNLGPDGLSLFVQNNYSWSEGSGNAYAVLFRQRNSAATVVASGYKRSNTAAFASSFGTSMARAAIAVGSNNGSIAFFTDTATNVANGTDITPTERVTIINSGNVGIGTTNPSGTYGRLSVAGGISILNDNNAKLEIGRYSSGASNSYIKLGANSNSLRFTNNTDIADIMELTNSGNLGLNITPSAWDTTQTKTVEIGTIGNYISGYIGSSVLYIGTNSYLSATGWKYARSSTAATQIDTGGGTFRFLYAASGTADASITWSESMRITSGGNVGINVTPSAWAATGLQIINAGLSSRPALPSLMQLSANQYWDGSNHRYISSNFATIYTQHLGVHNWDIAPSGTAGNTITWTQAMTLTSGGNIGIGVTAPDTRLNVIKEDNGGGGIGRFEANNRTQYVEIGYQNINQFASTPTNAQLTFSINSNERMRITNGGFIKASNNGTYLNANGSYHEFNSNVSGTAAIVIRNTHASTPAGPDIYFTASPNNTTQAFLYCADGTEGKFLIWSNGSVVNRTGTYGTISDIKYKENIVDATPKLNDIMQLKVRNFNLIGETTKQIGFIAQEFEEVFPSMIDVSTEKDKEGETYKSIKTSILIPMLVKAVQELSAKVAALEAQQ